MPANAGIHDGLTTSHFARKIKARAALRTRKAKQGLLFVNKKKQKNFAFLKHLAMTVPNPTGIKSFLCAVFQKALLA
jgi:hypothetical protein